MTRRDNPEEKIQITLMRHVALRGVKNVFVFAIPNGGYRSPTEALRLRAGGVTAGVPDLCAIIDGRPNFLELKTEKGRLADVQRVAHRKLSEAGATVETAYGLDDALSTLERWGALRAVRACDGVVVRGGVSA